MNKKCSIALRLLILVLLSPPVTATDIVTELEKLPVFRVEVGKSSTPLGTGEKLGQMIKSSYPKIERMLDAHLSQLMTAIEFKTIRASQLDLLRDKVDSDYLEEMRGITNKWSMSGGDSMPGDALLSLDEYHVLNLLTDLGKEPAGLGFGALGFTTKGNQILVGRNLSTTVTPQIRRLQAITVYEYDERAVVNIGFAGLVSVISGFNQDGLFVSNISAEPETPYKIKRQSKGDGKEIRPRSFDLRYALDKFETTSPVADFLGGKIYPSGSSTLIADEDEILVLEQPAEQGGNIRRADSTLRMERVWSNPDQLGIVNCFVMPLEPNRCSQKDMVRWMRLDVLGHSFSDTHVISISDMSNIMSDKSNYGYEVLDQKTLQSIVFVPENGDLYLYAMPEEGSIYPPVTVHAAYTDLLPLSYRIPQSIGYFGIFVWALLLTLIAALVLEPLWRKRSGENQEDAQRPVTDRA